MNSISKFICIMALFFISATAKAYTIVVEAPTAAIYDRPDGNAIARVTAGKKFRATRTKQSGYIKLSTKSGRQMWMRESDVVTDPDEVENDLVTGDAEEEEPAEKQYAKLTWDLGASMGSSGGVNYTEANVGLNYFFLDWIAWRNAVFARFTTPENVYGLDTSLRAFANLGLTEKSSMTFFGGPGFRFITKGTNVPFLEGGVIAKLGSFNIGGGAKYFMLKSVDSSQTDETQYFLILSGGGSL
jgi:hypothetical protein